MCNSTCKYIIKPIFTASHYRAGQDNDTFYKASEYVAIVTICSASLNGTTQNTSSNVNSWNQLF